MTTALSSQMAQTPRVSFRDLCSLFCCPPFPSAIVSKLAFMPPEPSYRIITTLEENVWVNFKNIKEPFGIKTKFFV